jgi:hypothetical protein
MAMQQNGYVFAPHLTYDEWRSYALTHGVNVDWKYGNQCVDICALLWYQYGLRLQTGNSYAYGCWTIMRNQNARGPFKMITSIYEVKRGDCVVFNRAGSYYTGHIAFADEDYNGSGRLKILGQNQGQGISSGTPSNVISKSVAAFLGAFRNTKWRQIPPPTPTPTKKEGNFPWVLYSRKLRQK